MALGVALAVAVHAGRHAAQGDALIEGHVFADLGRLPDDDAHAVVDEETVTDGGPRMDLDAGQDAPDRRDPAADQVPAPPPAGAGKAVEHDSLESWVAEHHLKARTRRRIALHRRIDFGPERLEHGFAHRAMIAALCRLVRTGGQMMRRSDQMLQ